MLFALASKFWYLHTLSQCDYSIRVEETIASPAVFVLEITEGVFMELEAGIKFGYSWRHFRSCD